MNWIILALLAPVLFTVTVYIDTYLLEREVKHPQGLPIFTAITGLIVGMIFWASSGFATIPIGDGMLIVLTGILNQFAAPLYFEAVSKSEESSTLIILFQMTTVIALVLAMVFLGETITLVQMLAFILMLSAAVGASLVKEKTEPAAEKNVQKPTSFRPSRAFFFVLGADFLWAASAILFKFVARDYPFSTLLSYESWGFAVGGLMLFAIPGIRKSFIETARTISKSGLGMIIVNEAFFIGGRLMILLAFTLGPVALVTAIGGTQVFFGIAVGGLLTLIAPTIFKEDVSRDGLLRKGGFAVLMFVGIVLITLSPDVPS